MTAEEGDDDRASVSGADSALSEESLPILASHGDEHEEEEQTSPGFFSNLRRHPLVAYAVVSMAGILGLSAAVPAPLTVLPLMMAKSSVLWSPIIYVTMHPPVQRQLCISHILSDILVSGRCSKILRTV